MNALKQSLLTAFIIGLVVLACHQAFHFFRDAPPPGTPISSPRDGGSPAAPKKATLQTAPPTTAAAYRRLARAELRKAKDGFEDCIKTAAADFDIAPNDPIVLEVIFRASPTGSDRALAGLKRLHSIPKVLDDWLKQGRAAGAPAPDWQPGPDLVPPDCLGPLLSGLELPAPPVPSVPVSWALASLQNLGVAPGAVPSP